MVKSLLSFVCGLSLSFTALAQTDIQMNILHKSGNDDFEYGMTMTNNLGYDYNVSRLEYYLSDFVLIHDGNTESVVEDLVVLANGDNVMSIIMGNHDVTNLEFIKFHVGVNPDLNHLDPSTYEAGHPLAVQIPSMHWGWAAGYKFVAVEGQVNGQDNYEFHGLGDANYYEVVVPVDLLNDNGWMEINLLADVSNIFENMSLDSDLISHGEAGNARRVLENMRDFVFIEYNSTLGIEDQLSRIDIEVYPNPSSNGTTNVFVHSKSNMAFEITVLDLMGREVKKANELQANVLNEVRIEKSGLYILNIQMADGSTASKKVIIQ